MENFLSVSVAAFREKYSCNHALIRHIENWEKALDENFQVGTLLLDLSKTFSCISDVLLIAKLYDYGLSEETTTFFHTIILEKKTCGSFRRAASFVEHLLA